MSALSRSGGLANVVRRVVDPKLYRDEWGKRKLDPHVLLPAVGGATSARRLNIRAFSLSVSPSMSSSAVRPVLEQDGGAMSAEPLVSTNFQFQQLDNKMYRMNGFVKRTARVSASEVKDILFTVKTLGSCSANHALMLIKCCGSMMVDECEKARMEIVHDAWKVFEEVGVSLDSSHYNALLRIYVENNHDFSPEEFLNQMEGKGIESNRVTYQNLIAKYCQSGDISGTTVILEHMKEKQMTVNENVFRSLIVGHCRSGDFESARGILPIMKKSGLTVGTETHIILLKEMVRAGKPGEEVMKEFEATDVSFNHGDYFGLMVELIRAGDVDTARQLTATLPKKSGFFQEMRNHIPEMMRLGEMDLPFEILQDFKVPNTGSDGHADGMYAERGVFFLSCLAQAEYPVDKVMSFVQKMESTDNGMTLVCRLLQSCVELEKIQYGQDVYLAATSIYKDDLDRAVICGHTWMANKTNSFATPVDAMRFLTHITSVGLKPLTSQITKYIFPAAFRDNAEPDQVLFDIKRLYGELPISLPPLPYGQLTNAILQYLLNRETKEAFESAVNFTFSLRIPMKPHIWNASLARSYLCTEDLHSLISMLGYGSQHVLRHVLSHPDHQSPEMLRQRDVDHFSSLCHLHSLTPRYRPELKNPDVVLEPILREMAAHNIGLPSAVAENLRKSAGSSDVVVELTHQLEEVFANGEEYWTLDRVQEWMQKRNKALRMNKLKLRQDFVDFGRRGYISDKRKIPTTFEEAERLQGILDKRGSFNSLVDSIILQKYFERGEVEEAEAAFQRMKESRAGKGVEPRILDGVVESYLKLNQVEKAQAFLKTEVEDCGEAGCYLKTYFQVAKWFFDQGKIDDGLSVMRGVDKTKVVSTIGINVEAANSLDYFANKGEVENQKKLFDCLDEVGFLDKSKAATYAPFVSLHVQQGDLEAAVSTFERLTRELKLTPYKYSLMKKLIELEDTEKMQRVLDASIEVLGEERALYDLAHNFLESGRTSQAKMLLETPGLRYNAGKIQYMVQMFIRRGNLKALEDLVYLSQPVFACNREYLYSKLVSVYPSDAEKCKEIWVNMQEEGYVPSDDLKNEMARVFRRAGQKPPFEEPAAYARAEAVETNAAAATTVKTTRVVAAPKPVAQMSPSVSEQVDRLCADIADGALPHRKFSEKLRVVSRRQDFSSDLAMKIVSAVASNIEFCKKFYSRAPFGVLTDAFNNAELEQAQRDVDGETSRLLLLSSRIYQRAWHEGGVEGLTEKVRQVLASNPEGVLPNSYVLSSVLKQDPGNFEKLRSFAEEVGSGSLSSSLVKSLILCGRADEAREVLAGMDEGKLVDYREGVRHADPEELMKLIDFVKENVGDNEERRQDISDLYNYAIKKLIVRGNVTAAQSMLDGNLDKWMSLSSMSHFTLRSIVNGVVKCAQTVQDEAAKILSEQKQQKSLSEATFSTSSGEVGKT